MIPVENAVILVAGEGKRLRPFTDTQPKCFVEVRGRRILENALAGLASHGCRAVRIVVGHLAPQIQSTITDRFDGMDIHYVLNSLHRTTNSMYSLALGLEGLTTSTWVIEGDVYFDDAILEMEGPAGIEWFVDSSRRDLDGAYVEAAPDGRARSLEIMRDVGAIRPGQCKSVGILRLSRSGSRLLYGWLQHGIDQNRQNDYYDLILRDHLGEGEVSVVDVAGHRWAEIDTTGDLEMAERIFT